MIELQNENLTLRVDPLGAQMMELRSRQGTQFLWNGDAKYWRDRAPVLFPYVARLTDGSYTLYGERYSMDIHGFAKDSVFSVEEQSADSVTFRELVELFLPIILTTSFLSNHYRSIGENEAVFLLRTRALTGHSLWLADSRFCIDC